MVRKTGFLVIVVFITLFALIAVAAEEQSNSSQANDSLNLSSLNNTVDINNANAAANETSNLSYSNSTVNDEPIISANLAQNITLVENSQASSANDSITNNDASSLEIGSSSADKNGRKAVAASFGVYLNIVG